MLYKYRAELNDGRIVDIFDFNGEYAQCDHGMGEIHINSINTVFIPRLTFIDMMNISTENTEDVEPVIKKKDCKK